MPTKHPKPQTTLEVKGKLKQLTPSEASMKIITPSHNLIAAVTSSEKFTCPGRSISNHAFHIPNLWYLLIAYARGDKNCNYFVILVSYFCDGLFYQIFRNHNYYSTLFLQTVPIFLGGWKKRHHKITVKFIEKNLSPHTCSDRPRCISV